SLTAGSSIGLETVKFDGQNVRLEVTAVSDTVLASPSDKSRRRCLHVSYQVEDRPGNWAEAGRDVWVEGIGSLKYGIMFPYYFGTTGGIMSLLECHAKDMILYKAPGNPNGINSSLVTRHSSTAYDLQGRRLTHEPQQGVFIRDGRKVVKGK
ncbi:MAG: hypothetical protein IJ659_04000, partial [Alloprevotella sp.]|nr:hypothetical protein [Alloprevotella sp.]